MIQEEKKNATDKAFAGLAASLNQGVILSSITSIDDKLQVPTPSSVSIPSEPSQEIMSAGIKGLSRYDVLLYTGATTGLIKESILLRNIRILPAATIVQGIREDVKSVLEGNMPHFAEQLHHP